jgi:hypothetical protein
MKWMEVLSLFFFFFFFYSPFFFFFLHMINTIPITTTTIKSRIDKIVNTTGVVLEEGPFPQSVEFFMRFSTITLSGENEFPLLPE